MSPWTIVAVVVVVAFIVYAVYAVMRAGRARTAELKALAPQLGMTFVGEFPATASPTATGDPRNELEALRAAFGDFRRFQGTTRPRLWNWMRGERDGVVVSLFDYDEGYRDRQTSTIQTLAWLESPSLRLPSFWLLPIPGRYVVPIAHTTHVVAGLVSSLRHPDVTIAVPTHPEFESRYLLRGQDEPALRRLFTDRVLSYFQHNPGWMVEGDGARLLLNRLSPDEVRMYWRSAGPTSDAHEIANAVSALREGTLGAKLRALPGVPPGEVRQFLTAALEVATLFRPS